MNLERLEKHLQRLSDTLSEFDDALIDTQENFVLSPSVTDIRRRRLLSEIDSDLSDISGNVCGIGEKIEQLNFFEKPCKFV